MATMTVVILQPSENNISVNTTSSYTWHGTTYTTSGDYTWIGTNSNGCDSLVSLHLIITVSVFSDTAVVYPNPAPDGLIKINLEKFHISNIYDKEIRVSIYNSRGRRCLVKSLFEKVTMLNMNQLSKGTYFINIISKDQTIKYSTKLLR